MWRQGAKGFALVRERKDLAVVFRMNAALIQEWHQLKFLGRAARFESFLSS